MHTCVTFSDASQSGRQQAVPSTRAPRAHQDTPGSSDCKPCEAGYFSGHSGAVKCSPCPPGTYMNRTSCMPYQKRNSTTGLNAMRSSCPQPTLVSFECFAVRLVQRLDRRSVFPVHKVSPKTKKGKKAARNAILGRWVGGQVLCPRHMDLQIVCLILLEEAASTKPLPMHRTSTITATPLLTTHHHLNYVLVVSVVSVSPCQNTHTHTHTLAFMRTHSFAHIVLDSSRTRRDRQNAEIACRVPPRKQKGMRSVASAPRGDTNPQVEPKLAIPAQSGSSPTRKSRACAPRVRWATTTPTPSSTYVHRAPQGPTRASRAARNACNVTKACTAMSPAAQRASSVRQAQSRHPKTLLHATHAPSGLLAPTRGATNAKSVRKGGMRLFRARPSANCARRVGSRKPQSSKSARCVHADNFSLRDLATTFFQSLVRSVSRGGSRPRQAPLSASSAQQAE